MRSITWRSVRRRRTERHMPQAYRVWHPCRACRRLPRPVRRERGNLRQRCLGSTFRAGSRRRDRKRHRQGQRNRKMFSGGAGREVRPQGSGRLRRIVPEGGCPMLPYFPSPNHCRKRFRILRKLWYSRSPGNLFRRRPGLRSAAWRMWWHSWRRLFSSACSG